MSRRILIIDGHPDTNRDHFVHALAAAYAEGAAEHETRAIRVAELDFPLIRSQAQWAKGEVPAAIADAQQQLLWAEHIVLLYPLWLGDVPALLKGFLEQVMRPDFAFRYRPKGLPEKLLAGRSARVVVTMGMPAFFYRIYYGAHSLKSLERNILKFVGIGPIAHNVVGAVEGSEEARLGWLEEMRELGRQGA